MLEEKTLINATVCFPTKEGEILLALKTKKIGQGCWNGYGGGIELGETSRSATIRELFEESGITAKESGLEKVAVIDFHNTKSDSSTFVCRVHFYLLSSWSGTPQETEEMITPTWFPARSLPLNKMMPADKIFIPLVLSGKKILGTVHYGPFQKELLREPSFTEVQILGDD